MEDFDLWWSHYPKKVAKADARKAWKQTERIRPSTDTLIKMLIVARASDGWRADCGKFIPHPATYLRGERWEDVHDVDLDGVEDGKAWNETVSGIEKKGRELQLEWNARVETFQQYAKRVKEAVESYKLRAVK